MLGFTFITNEIGERLTTQFNAINKEINRCDWYLYPIEIQRMLPTIMINAQKASPFECLKIISCSRKQLKQV